MVELVLRITFSLLVVLALMWGLARLVRRPLTGGRGGAGALAVLTRQQLSRGSSVAVVRVADRAIVLGVTDTQVSLLCEADLSNVESYLHQPVHERRAPVELPGAVPLPHEPPGALDGSVLSPKTWRSVVNLLRERTTRR